MADDVYTFESFLRGVAKFPAFCAESNLDNLNEEQTCAREIATLLAHIIHESMLNDPWKG